MGLVTFSDTQNEIAELWKRHKKAPELEQIKRVNLCPKCAKLGYRIKMDFMKDGYTVMKMSRYKFEIYGCPRCHWLDKRFARIEGQGTSGVDLGSMYGGI